MVLLSSVAHDLFHVSVPWSEKLIRALAVYGFLLVAIRVFGRRELGQLTAFDLIVLLTLSNVLQNAMIGNDNSLLGGMVGAVVLLAANFVVAWVVFRSHRVERLVEGSPRILIHDGEVHRDALRLEKLTDQDLLSAIRREGLERIEDVHLAISDPNGLISIIRAGRPSPEGKAG
ncbi:MAG TPA: YetF domain-containing protein [Actinomycetota bacterium]|nr:YetF domain-containing protein [Actinomycetota bacterium]